jgi:hypothetical protein
LAKEVIILIGRELGASVTELSGITGLDTSNVSRRYDAAKRKLEKDTKLSYAKSVVAKKYYERIAETQA